MTSILSPLWRIYRSYQPNARQDRQAHLESLSFGVFQATYSPRGAGWGIRRPRTDKEAQMLETSSLLQTHLINLSLLEISVNTRISRGQKLMGTPRDRLYNHIRTVAFWLDAAPLLSDLGLPFRAGIDDIISLVPVYGDLVSGLLQLYQVWLCFIFGVPRNVWGYMIVNVLFDVLVGFVPILGDFLDNLFKSNLRNLALLETWLLDPTSSAKRYHILLMPDVPELVPKVPKSSRPKASGASKGWFGFGGQGVGVDEARVRDGERKTGKVRVTRRMDKEEGEPVRAAPAAGRRRGDPVMDPVD